MSAATTPGPRRLSLAAQYVAYLLEFVSVAALKRPGSPVFRAALAEGVRRSGIALAPSRREVARGLIELDAAGRLAAIIASRSGSASFYRDDWSDDWDLDTWDFDTDLADDIADDLDDWEPEGEGAL